jgi:hypothetical protein
MKQMNTISVIALILIFLGGIGAILLTIGQSISSSEDKNDIINTTKSENLGLKNDLKDIKIERNKLNKTLEKRDAKIQEQNDSIFKLNEKLAEKSDYIQNYLTGGKGFPILYLNKMINDKNNMTKYGMELENNSDLPIYYVSCHVMDYDKIEPSIYTKANSNIKFVTQKDLDNSIIFNYTFSEMSPHVREQLGFDFDLKSGRYRAKLSTRNIKLVQKIALLNVGKETYYGYKTVTYEGKTIFETKFIGVPQAIKKILKEQLESIPTDLTLTLQNNLE